jgi:ribosomal protein L29
MKKEDLQTFLLTITDIKKNLLIMRMKESSGEKIDTKDYKNKKKEVARLFTKINNKKD